MTKCNERSGIVVKIRSPSMTELHAFVTVARVGSFTGAAKELCVTQAAISRAIHRLELHFGQLLLGRSAHRLTLTPAGSRYLEQVRAAVASIEDASAILMSSGSKSQMTLSVLPTLASVWLLSRLPEFTQRHPEITINFTPYRRDEDFSGSSPDAAILSGAASDWPATWDCDYVIGKEVVPVVSVARFNARHNSGAWIAPADLMSEPLLYHTSSPDRWRLWFEEAGVQNARPKLASGFDQVSILVQAVKADLGIAVLQRCLIQDELASGQLMAPFDLPVSMPKGYYFCVPAQRRGHHAIETFRQWLLERASNERMPSP